MKQLLVDIGNSRLKWALDEEQILQSGIVGMTDNDLVAKLHHQWQQLQPELAVLCSVAGEQITETISATIRENWSCPLHKITVCDNALGVTNAYTVPAQLGADRWVALFAARKLVPGPVCIVDCGTAITVDVMDEKGQHLGGAILPGTNLQRQMLKQETAGVDWQKLKSARLLLGQFPGLPIKSTTAAVEYGTSYGLAGAIDRLIIEFSGQLGDNMTVLLTGGAAPDIADLLSSDYRMEKDLVFIGLSLFGRSLANKSLAGASIK
ncbi:MAG: type III pantothenate kinase [Acidiferrobacterales bacterium]